MKTGTHIESVAKRILFVVNTVSRIWPNCRLINKLFSHTSDLIPSMDFFFSHNKKVESLRLEFCIGRWWWRAVSVSLSQLNRALLHPVLGTSTVRLDACFFSGCFSVLNFGGKN